VLIVSHLIPISSRGWDENCNKKGNWFCSKCYEETCQTSKKIWLDLSCLTISQVRFLYMIMFTMHHHTRPDQTTYLHDIMYYTVYASYIHPCLDSISTPNDYWAGGMFKINIIFWDFLYHYVPITRHTWHDPLVC